MKLIYFYLLATIVFQPQSSIAGAPYVGPPPTEGSLKANIQQIEITKGSVLPGDNFPRNLRLAEAKYRLGEFYNEKKRFAEADRLYAEVFSILSKDKSEAGIDYYRYHADLVAKALINRGELDRAKTYIDTAVSICRNNEHEKSVLPDVLSTLARWYSLQKDWKSAETTLLEAIKLRGQYAISHQIQLAELYLSTNELDKADKIISDASKSKYAGSAVQFLRARWLRAMGKGTEARDLETEANKNKEAERKRLEATM